MAKKEHRKLTKKLLHKYRLVILNEDTFEERLSFKLTRLNVIAIVFVLSIVLIVATSLLIAYTPLKEFIPGYALTKNSSTESLKLFLKADSLEQELEKNERFINSIQKVLRGDVSPMNLNKDSIMEIIIKDTLNIDFSISKEDSLLRQKVEKEDKYNFFDTSMSVADYALFPPVKGTVTSTFSIESKHYAVDVAVAKDSPVKAVSDGRVVFAEWTSSTGFVMILEHKNGLLSVYKHNNALTKTQGDLVKAGEVIAKAGNAGELSTGPHLHFELWSNGYPINPLNYIDFGDAER